MLIVLLASPQQVASLCSPSLLSHLAGLRLLQLRMEKEELEEEEERKKREEEEGEEELERMKNKHGDFCDNQQEQTGVFFLIDR